ncbi:MAG: carbon-nitrogen family hydrolase [Anaerolineae bacterium]
MSISLVQMNIALGDVRKNLKTVEDAVAEAARRGSHLVVLPELWATGYALEQGTSLASDLNAGVFGQVAALAAQHKLCIVGSHLERRGMQVANSAPFIDPRGQVRGVYRKIHLFRLMDEDRYLQPGSAPLLLDLPWGATAFAICYDLRFPELFRRYAVEGAKLIVIPAEWPIERVEHWRALLVARAIENQCYIIATNACGQTGDTTFGGHSMIVDPWGKIVLEVGEQPALATGEIELELVDAVRKRIPVFDDRRPELYSGSL